MGSCFGDVVVTAVASAFVLLGAALAASGDPLEGIERRPVPLHQAGPFFSAGLSHDGALLALQRDGTVEIYDAISGRARSHVEIGLPRGSGGPRLYSLSSGGAFALFAGPGVSRTLVDLETGAEKLSFGAFHEDWCGPRHVAFDAYPYRGEIHYVDLGSKRPERRSLPLLEGHPCVADETCAEVLLAGLHRAPRVVAAPWGPQATPRIVVADLAAHRVVREIQLPGRPQSLSVSPDDTTAAVEVSAAGSKALLVLVDLESGETRSLEGAPSRVVHAWHRETGLLYLAGQDTLMVVEPGRPPRIRATLGLSHIGNAGFLGILFDRSAPYGYVTEPYGKQLHVVDTRSLERVHSEPTTRPLAGILVSRALGIAAEFEAYLPFE